MESNSQPLGFCQRLINFIICRMNRPATPDPDITVEFKHTDGSQKLTQTDDRTIVQSGLENKGNQQQSSDLKTDAPGKRPKKSVTIMESVREGETHKNNPASKVHRESHEDAKLKPPRHWGPLQSVSSHINEKSQAYIDSTIRALRRNFSVDQEKS